MLRDIRSIQSCILLLLSSSETQFQVGSPNAGSRVPHLHAESTALSRGPPGPAGAGTRMRPQMTHRLRPIAPRCLYCIPSSRPTLFDGDSQVQEEGTAVPRKQRCLSL